jgi:hypothetical protein
MSKSNKAAEFLRNMTLPSEPPPAPANRDRVEEEASAAAPEAPPAPKAPKAIPKSVTSRASLKHIGGYLDSDTVEKVALLRARLKLDNSELMKLAIEELYRKQAAKRAFGD